MPTSSPWRLDLHLNRRPPLAQDALSFGAQHVGPARALLSEFMDYAPTPLRHLPWMERELGVEAVLLKDESARMGLGSFKALGGAHAVLCHVRRHGTSTTVACASAGNHGLSVAAGARAAGVRSVVCLSESVPQSFEARLHALGAETLRGGRDYEASLRLLEARAKQRGWTIISDTVPLHAAGEDATPVREVMQGYTVLCDEAAADCERQGGPATHVFVQAGVGGLAAVCASYLRERWGDVVFVVVEPMSAACLLESARRGAPAQIPGGRTILGRLDCREPSVLAFRVLSPLAHAFAAITDAGAEEAARAIARDGIAQSPCGAAGAAGLLAACHDAGTRSVLGIDSRARILLIGTEAPVPS
ncbi:pyridoxal-phosphate dependent enzyme [Pendulispora brunnea]|uniref:Pyridoxal-phosphate dependent enzyme n=1 Tax=Pendulispora brunnea TaxID=2905690 RepID=A0ABZ2KB19_9BACT